MGSARRISGSTTEGPQRTPSRRLRRCMVALAPRRSSAANATEARHESNSNAPLVAAIHPPPQARLGFRSLTEGRRGTASKPRPDFDPEVDPKQAWVGAQWCASVRFARVQNWVSVGGPGFETGASRSRIHGKTSSGVPFDRFEFESVGGCTSSIQICIVFPAVYCIKCCRQAASSQAL